MNRPRAMAFDLDGTLAQSKLPLSPQMGALLARLLDEMPVAVMSGAGFPQFQKQFLSGMPENSRFEGLYLFPANAALCYTFQNGTWHPQYQNELSPQEKEQVMAAFDTALAETGFHETPSPVWGERIEDRGSQISFSGLGQQAPLDAKKAWDPDGVKKRAIRAALLPLLPDFNVNMGGTTTIDITKKGIDKAYGVERLSEMTGIPISEMLYVGDALFEGGNDNVVRRTGIPTAPVETVEDTADLIASVL